MLDFIIHIDHTLFLLLNRDAANPFFDWLMPVITDVDNWTVPILLIWLYLMIFGGKKGRITGIGLIFLITMSCRPRCSSRSFTGSGPVIRITSSKVADF
jgi:hypothetical protein